MKPLPETPELLAVAERVVWFKPPRETLADPVHFLAHVMTYGTVEDLAPSTASSGRTSFEKRWITRRPACSMTGRGPTGISNTGDPPRHRYLPAGICNRIGSCTDLTITPSLSI
jgi:hypothetical protein